MKAFEYYTELTRFSPPDAPNYYWQETLDAYKPGKVAMAMDYFAFLLPVAVFTFLMRKHLLHGVTFWGCQEANLLTIGFTYQVLMS